ncbi:PREDICTED: RNA-binding protein 28-like [Branchiostoma belcheri]|uniref:RNA-binding protein 28-like n=1 Tax=Branchiostoma belcheri TaxID=7741 RepID=A0A6P4ZCY9_BRABE|nr:PREDICTED: RNA-binding protein 28-like [Branchiostoma belcheri]
MADSDEKSSRTLFVRNLPFTATNGTLEEIFSDAGPIKECFVVREPGVTDKCRGFGFVTFALREDAVKARAQPVMVQGRKVLVSFADKKPKKRKKEEQTEQEGEDKQTSSPEDKKKRRVEHSTAGRVIVLKNLPAKVKEEKIQKLVSKYEGVEEVTFPAPDTDQPSALVRFSSNTLARKALPALGSLKVKKSALKAVLQSKDNKTPSKKSLKKSRIIVRNLSFKCSKEDLRKTFEQYGEITDVHIPTVQGGKKRGFGFVQFTSVFEAAKAVAEMNSKPLHGRPVAVDYAVAKNRYESAKTAADRQEPEDGDSGDDDDDDDDDSGTEEEEETGEEQEEDGNDGEEDEEEEEEEDSDDFSDDEDDEKVDKKSKTPKPFRESTDVQQGKTVFIRNLSYDSLEEDVEELFLQFGGIKYCKLVMDPNTEHSRGTAFVQFDSKEAAEKCVQQATTEGLSLAGRRLTVSIAVSRQQAQKLADDKKEKKPTDKRNLYLAREGLIRPGTQAAAGLTEKDLAMRQKVEKIKREKLKNPAIFVSDVRLCVRNIPLNMGDKDLRRLYLKTLGDKNVYITESRVMRDLKNVNSQGVGKSRGYGFVTFSQHEHALRALRETNNNPKLLPDGRRLIVEFSLENKLALKKQEMRLAKAKAARQAAAKGSKKPEPERNGRNKPNINKPTQPTAENSGQPTLSRKQKRKLRQQQRREKIQQEKLEGLGGLDVSNLQSGVKAVRGTKGLPSHSGPKVRQRDRGKVVQQTVKKPRPKSGLNKTKQQPLQQGRVGGGQTPPQQSRRSNKTERKEEAKFDLLVDRYKQKLFGKDSGSQMKKSKWFNG